MARLITKPTAFSVVEVILAGAIFSLLIMTFVGGYLYGQEASALAGARARATLLAEEGLEAVKIFVTKTLLCWLMVLMVYMFLVISGNY